MIKITDAIGEKKEGGNIFEFSILGMYQQHSRTDLKLVSEEICKNVFLTYFYEISTFLLESYQGFQNVTNLIEYHHNLNENYKTNEFKIDNGIFYNGVNYMEKLDEYLTISKFYMKYITNSYLNFPLGSCSIIEMARCEENMNLILTSLGYKEKSKIKKRGEFIKFRNLPIIICLNSVEKLNLEIDHTIHSDKNPSMTPQKKLEIPPAALTSTGVNSIIEIIGFCYENEKDSLFNVLSSIKEKLSPYCIFESDLQSES